MEYRKFSKKTLFFFVPFKKLATFALGNPMQHGEIYRFLGLWCNGNTADSGPAFPGSSPGSPTKKQKRKRMCPYGHILFRLPKHYCTKNHAWFFSKTRMIFTKTTFGFIQHSHKIKKTVINQPKIGFIITSF